MHYKFKDFTSQLYHVIEPSNNPVELHINQQLQEQGSDSNKDLALIDFMDDHDHLLQKTNILDKRVYDVEDFEDDEN